MCSSSEAGSYLTLVSLSLRFKDLPGPVTRVKKKKKKLRLTWTRKSDSSVSEGSSAGGADVNPPQKLSTLESGTPIGGPSFLNLTVAVKVGLSKHPRASLRGALRGRVGGQTLQALSYERGTPCTTLQILSYERGTPVLHSSLRGRGGGLVMNLFQM